MRGNRRMGIEIIEYINRCWFYNRMIKKIISRWRKLKEKRIDNVILLLVMENIMWMSMSLVGYISVLILMEFLDLKLRIGWLFIFKVTEIK